jgi:hypothetical protein
MRLCSAFVSGMTVTLVEMRSPPSVSSASMSTSVSAVCSTFFNWSSIHALSSTKNSCAGVCSTRAASARRMRSPAALHVTMAPCSSSVMTPFDIDSSIASL